MFLFAFLKFAFGLYKERKTQYYQIFKTKEADFKPFLLKNEKTHYVTLS